MTAPPNAGIASRLIGLVIDVAVLTTGGLALTTLPGVAAEQVTGEAPGWITGLAATLGALLPWLYFSGCWWLTGQTVGALAIGIQVRRTGGGDLGPVRAGLRAAVGLLFFPVWLVGLVGVIFDDRRRAWHDRTFGTEVAYTRRPAAS